MQKIVHTIAPMSAIYSAPFRFALYSRLLMLVVVIALINIGVSIFSQSAQPVLATGNPFLDYADIFPGQAATALNTHPFSCSTNYDYGQSQTQSCAMPLASGKFSQIDTVINNERIQSTRFTLRDDTFKAGDLVLLFELHNYRTYPGKVFFFWKSFFVTGSTAAKGKPAAMRAVWQVTFSDAP